MFMKFLKIGQIISLLGIFSDPLLSYGNIKRINKKHASPRYQSNDRKSLLKPNIIDEKEKIAPIQQISDGCLFGDCLYRSLICI